MLMELTPAYDHHLLNDYFEIIPARPLTPATDKGPGF
jgi:hypothetical protein